MARHRPAGSDYTANSGTVNFADGETVAKTITVPITDDAVDEADETFTVTLEQPDRRSDAGYIGFQRSRFSITTSPRPGVLSIDPPERFR